MDLKKVAEAAIEMAEWLVDVEDFGTSAGAKKGWLTRKGAPREVRDAPHRDSLGALPDKSNTSSFTRAKNADRGAKAVSRALRQHADVKNAMFTKELGWIDFDWGTPGDPKKKHAGGWGLSHILAKHGEDIKSLPDTIATGECREIPRTYDKDGNPNSRRFCVIKAPYIAILDSRGRDGSFCVSEYQKSLSELAKYRKNPMAEPRVLS